MFFYFTLSGYLNMMGHKVFPTIYFIILENLILNLMLLIFYPSDLRHLLSKRSLFNEYTFNYPKINYLKDSKKFRNSDDSCNPIIVLNPYFKDDLMNSFMIGQYIKS